MMIFKIIIFFKAIFYALLSSYGHRFKSFKFTLKNNYPILIRGKGVINISESCQIGVCNSPFYLNSYCYLEARSNKSQITINENVRINNSFTAITVNKSILIDKNTLIGPEVMILGSNGHGLKANERSGIFSSEGSIAIAENTFICARVTILHSVKISKNSIIPAGRVVRHKDKV